MLPIRLMYQGQVYVQAAKDKLPTVKELPARMLADVKPLGLKQSPSKTWVGAFDAEDAGTQGSVVYKSSLIIAFNFRWRDWEGPVPLQVTIADATIATDKLSTGFLAKVTALVQAAGLTMPKLKPAAMRVGAPFNLSSRDLELKPAEFVKRLGKPLLGE